MNTNKVLIIAEAGVNHNGSFEIAERLIKAAAESGADFVKFQTFKADKIVSLAAKKATYQKANTSDGDDSQYEMLKKLEIPEDWYQKIISLCKEHNIGFLSTGFDEDSIDFLDQYNPEFYKIPSGEITNKPYLEHVAKKGKPIVISTGMATIQEIQNAVDVIVLNGISKENITVLHCNTEYPTPMKDVNLLAMLHIKNELGVEVGYSDHTEGIEIPTAATALGAKVIEKHFTLDKSMNGPDHRASLEPDELKDMVQAIRNIELAISGSGVKTPSDSEKKNLDVVRKSIYIKNNLLAGQSISKEDLIMLRPGNGISPMEIDQVIGKKLIVNKCAGEQLNKTDFIC